jgi:hypothetical protein
MFGCFLSGPVRIIVADRINLVTPTLMDLSRGNVHLYFRGRKERESKLKRSTSGQMLYSGCR